MELLGQSEVTRHRAPLIAVELLQQFQSVGVVRIGPQNLTASFRSFVKFAFLTKPLRTAENHRQAQGFKLAAKVLLIMCAHAQTFDPALKPAEIILVGKIPGLEIVDREGILNGPSNAM